MKRLIFSFIVLSFCFFSCSKEKDEVSPKITVISPGNGLQINAFDSIQITFEASDDVNLDNVQVSLRNNDDIIVSHNQSKRPNTKTYKFDELYIINELHLESGSYYFDISASDGENTTHKYVQVSLSEATRYREGIFISSYNGSSSDVYLMDNTFQTSYYKNFIGDVLDIAVNSYDQQLIHTCYKSGSIIATNLSSSTQAWSVPGSSSSLPYFTGAFLGSDNKLYTGYYDGRFKAFNNSGQASVTGFSNVNTYIEQAALLDDFYITEQKSIVAGQVKIVLNWAASGAQYQQISVNEDIKGIYRRTTNEFVLLTNTASNSGKVVFYYLNTGLIGSPFSVSIGEIKDCLEVSTGLYLVAEGNNLTYINSNTMTTQTFLSGVTANLLRYDRFTNELFVVNGSQLTIYDFSSKAIKSTYVHSANIVDLDFWYNK